ncbi:MAG: His/Gly/Thr/Pro-type tRNA ligase C-terminal domain-containing protein, partial [Candidatus Omnitrophica bacterium]|nr:His/Gly/Thr/Pro-type tRNA ligase C-terminal domain-containing protein [Candidatus Omnitrophota bacterium]
ERLLLARKPESPKTASPKLAYIITMGEEAKKSGLKLLDELRKEAIACDMDHENKSLKGAMRSANDAKAGYVLIIGEDELKKDTVALKDMASGEQKEIQRNDLITELKKE